MSVGARRLVAAGVSVIVAAGLLSTAVVSSAAAAGSQDHLLTGLSSASGIVATGGRVFVATGARVAVYSESGTSVGSVPAVSTAKSVSVGGGSVWASFDSGIIMRIDPVTLAATSFAVDECPGRMAYSAQGLFFGSGCVDQVVDRLDPDTGAVSPVLVDGDPVAAGGGAMLAAAGDMLYVTTRDRSPSSFTAYTVAGSTATLAWSKQPTNTPVGVVAWPGHVALGVYGHGTQLWDATGAATGAFPDPALVWQLAVSADGTRLAMLENGGDLTIGATSNRAVVVRRDVDSPVFVVAMAFNDSGSRVFSLWEYDSQVRLIVSGTTAPVPTSLSLTAKAPAKVGGTVSVTVHAPAGRVVTITATDNDGTRMWSRTVTMPSSGSLSTSYAATLSGSVVARSAADDLHNAGTSNTVRYTAPSVLQTAVTGKVKHGKVTYKRLKAMRAAARVVPLHTYRSLTATLQRLNGKHWKKVQKIALSSEQYTAVGIHMSSANAGVWYRIRFAFSGDRYSGRAHPVVTPPFRFKGRTGAAAH